MDVKTWNKAIEKAAKQVPSNWIDSDLTGKEAVVGSPPYGCDDIERILNRVRGKIYALAKVISPEKNPGAGS